MSQAYLSPSACPLIVNIHDTLDCLRSTCTCLPALRKRHYWTKLKPNYSDNSDKEQVEKITRTDCMYVTHYHTLLLNPGGIWFIALFC